MGACPHGGKAAKEAKPNWLLIKEHDEYEQTASDEPIVEKEPNSVLTNRDMDAIAREEDHVWQSNRPEGSGSDKKVSAPLSPRRSFREKRKLCRRLLLPSWHRKHPHRR